MTNALTFLGLCALAASFASVDVIPKNATTRTAITETSVRIELYHLHNKRLPDDLTALPTRPGYANRTTDAWDRPLQYTKGADDAFTLSSFGKDGVAGGTSDNADVVSRYKIEDGIVRDADPTPRTP